MHSPLHAHSFPQHQQKDVGGNITSNAHARREKSSSTATIRGRGEPADSLDGNSQANNYSVMSANPLTAFQHKERFTSKLKLNDGSTVTSNLEINNNL